MKVKVNEIFGPTFQGEGPSLGQLCNVIRLDGCNLTCKGCYWDWYIHEEPLDVDFDKIISKLYELDKYMRMCVITGGEPLIWMDAVEYICSKLKIHGVNTEIETNGTIKPEFTYMDDIQYNVNLKLANSGNRKSSRFNFVSLGWFADNPKAIFKFIINDIDDFQEVDELVKQLAIPKSRIWIRPMEIRSSKSDIMEKVLCRRWNLTTKLMGQL